MSSKMHFAHGAAFLVALLVPLLAAEGAEAQRRRVGDFEGAVELHPSIGLGDGAGTGVGFDLRGTYWAAREGKLRIGPDFVVGWVNVPFGDFGSASAVRLMAGIRGAIPSGSITPSFYGRVGFHPSSGRHRGPWWAGPFPVPHIGGIGLEGGGAIDAAVSPNVGVGGHMGLNLVTSGFAYLNLGAHLAVRF